MTRDLRDPQKLGELIAKVKPGNSWEAVVGLTVPDYDHGESTVDETVRQYRAELVEAASRGDRHAADTLKGIPNDDPSG